MDFGYEPIIAIICTFRLLILNFSRAVKDSIQARHLNLSGNLLIMHWNVQSIKIINYELRDENEIFWTDWWMPKYRISFFHWWSKSIRSWTTHKAMLLINSPLTRFPHNISLQSLFKRSQSWLLATRQMNIIGYTNSGSIF